MRKIKPVIRRRRLRSVLVVAAALLGVMLIAGCGPASIAAQAQQLEQQYPWLSGLGISFIEWLIQTYGPDIAGLLSAAMAALG